MNKAIPENSLITYNDLKGIKVYYKMPAGWDYIKGALTAPHGYKWINNKKSFFSKDYDHALLLTDEYKNRILKAN